MKKNYKILLFLFMIIFSISFGGNKKGEKIIKAYDKGKPAQLNIEITKVKSDNYVEMTIDRKNMKIYKDITDFSPENRDLDSKLFVTDYLKKVDKSDLNRTLPYKVIDVDDKKYLEIDYSGIGEPKEVYLWVVRRNKVKKLYTGIIKNEYFDPNDPSTFVHMEIENDDKKKIVEVGENHLVFKVGEIRLKNDINDTMKISVPSEKEYFLKQQDVDYPVDLYFNENENESEVYLNQSQNTATLYGKYVHTDKNLLPPEGGILAEEDSPTVNLEVQKVQRSRSAAILSNESEPLPVNDYSVSTMSFMDPWIDAYFDMSGGNTASVTIKSYSLLGTSISSNSENLESKAGTVTHRVLSTLGLVRNIEVSIFTSDSITPIRKSIDFSESSWGSDYAYTELESLIKIRTYRRNPGVLKYNSLTIDVTRLSNKVERVDVTYHTKYTLLDSLFPEKFETVSFHFLNESLNFEVEVSDLNFGEIYHSPNITFGATGTVKLTSIGSFNTSSYTLEFMKGNETTTTKTISLEGVKEQDLDPETEQITVTDLGFDEGTTTNGEKDNGVTTFKMSGSIKDVAGKVEGSYSAIARVRITRVVTKGGQTP